LARRTFTVIDLTELYVHWWAGRSQVQLSDSLGIDRKTVRKYLAPAEAEVEAGTLVPGTVMTGADWRARIGSGSGRGSRASPTPGCGR
jgi:hypothetical protein